MLNSEQLNFYADNGYLLVKGVLDRSEAAHYRAEAHALIDRVALRGSVEATWDSAKKLAMGATSLKHCHNVQFESSHFAQLMCDPRLTDVAAAIMQTPNVQLHHNKLFIKPPAKGSPFPMHQDYPYFPHANHSMIAAIIHFDAAPLEKGCVRVVPGSHKQGPVEHEADRGFYLPFDRYPLDSAMPCEAEAGDVLFFSYLTIHGSGVNVSDEARTTLLIQMRDPTDPPTVNRHTSRGQGMMLRGVNQGAGYAQFVQPL